MDNFYKELAALLSIIKSRSTQNERYLSRVLDAKDAILTLDPMADEDAPLISRLLDDHLKTHALLSDYKTEFEKLMQMYS